MKKALLKMAFFMGAIAFISSCDLEGLEITETGDTVQTVDEAKGVVEENSEAELQVVKVFENVNNYGIIEEGKKSAKLDAPSYSLDGNVLTIDFAGVDQSAGKVIASFNKFPFPFYQKGLSATISFDGYESAGIAIEGEFVLTITDVDDSSVKFNMESTEYMTFTDGAGSSFEWKCTQDILWSEGYNTKMDASDDDFVVDGSSKQVIETKIHDMTVEGLTLTSDCDYIVDGLITVTAHTGTDDQFTVTTEFGVNENKEDVGECDAWILMNSVGLVENLHIKISAL